MKHLVVGASGQVGSHLLRALEESTHSVVGTYHTRSCGNLIPLNLEDPANIRALLAEVRPNVVWMPAALPDVDRCQREPELSHRVNVEAVQALASEATAFGARFIFYSTDYVFDGSQGPYLEDDAPNPLQVYGAHKLEAERWLIANIPEVLVIRTAWVYSQEDNPRNFTFRIKQQLASGQRLKAATDQVSTPTSAEDLALRSLKAEQERLSGILHLVGPTRLSRYEWTVSLAQEFGYSTDIVDPILTKEVGLAALRPLNGGLVTRWNG